MKKLLFKLCNGDENFNFFFIEPYSSKIISIIPDNLSISSGLTEATFQTKFKGRLLVLFICRKCKW